MNEEQARKNYWKAVELLREIIEADQESKKEIMEELEDDL